MKKAISLLVAIAAAASLTVSAFASDDIPESATPRASAYAAATPRISLTGPNDDVVIGDKELVLIDESNKMVGGVYNRLDPDTEYTFRIFYNKTGSTIQTGTPTDILNNANIVELTGAMLDGGSVRLRTVKGSANMQSARIKTIGRGDTARYELVLTTRATFGTKVNEVQYSLGVTGSKQPADTFVESSHIFEVGYENIDDEATDIGEGGYITISNDYPVITKEQFVDIAKSVNYKTVNFESEDGGWRFTGRVSGMSDSNFYYTYDVIPELVNKYPDQEYKFLNFRSGVTFPASGEMRIDVSDINDDFGNMYAYLYRNGKLTPIDSTYDTGANEIVFRTNYLGSFVITDKKITDTSIVTDNDDEDDEDEDDDDNTNNNNNNNNGSGNPNTGASSAMNVAMTLGLASLATAGLVSRKKK